MSRRVAGLGGVGIVLLLIAASVRAQAPAAKLEAKVDPAEVAFRKLDRDGNQQLSLDEFRVVFAELRQQARLRRLHGQFQTRDSNRDGSLDASEFAGLLLVKSLGSKAPVFAVVDADANERVDFREYLAMIEKFVESAPAAAPRP